MSELYDSCPQCGIVDLNKDHFEGCPLLEAGDVVISRESEYSLGVFGFSYEEKKK